MTVTTILGGVLLLCVGVAIGIAIGAAAVVVYTLRAAKRHQAEVREAQEEMRRTVLEKAAEKMVARPSPFTGGMSN